MKRRLKSWLLARRLRRAVTPDDMLPHYRGFGKTGRWDPGPRPVRDSDTYWSGNWDGDIR
jgi:hypothetical protein